MTPTEQRAYIAGLEKALEICESHLWRGTASQLCAAIDELRAMLAAAPSKSGADKL